MSIPAPRLRGAAWTCRIGMGVIGLAVLFATSPARAVPVDCSNPDNLCTGDPCVIGTVDVLSPCVVDFGARDLFLAGRIRVPNAGVLSFTAATITAKGSINGRHLTMSEGDGASVALIASGDLLVIGRIDVSARNTAGSMTLRAGGNVELRRLLRAASRGVPPFATGGSIEIDAGGTVVGLPRARIDVRGGRGGTATAGGQVQVTGALGVTLVDEIRAAGSKGGSVEITSVAGDILLEEAISTRGEELEGGPILIAAGGEVTTVETIAATGNLAGGSVSILAGGALNLDTIAARGIEGTAGSITVASAFGTVGADRLRADGQNGGSITLFSGDAAHADLLLARGVHDGGLISVDAVGDVSITDVDATGDVGGTVVVESSGGFIACDGVDVSGSDAGGSATLDAAAEILAGGELAASGGGGEIRLRGTAIPGIADVDVSSRGITAGGLLLVESTVGEVLMDDDYDATGSPGGTIQVEAAGNLTASGDFTVAAGGCIGLSAGGTLETSGGTFDIPVTPTCGASPSGAFLDGILMY